MTRAVGLRALGLRVSEACCKYVEDSQTVQGLEIQGLGFRVLSPFGGFPNSAGYRDLFFMGPFPTAGTARIPVLGGADGWDLCDCTFDYPD